MSDAAPAPPATPAAPDLSAFLTRRGAPPDRTALVALAVLGAVLHLRSLAIGYLDRDLLTLEKVVRASLGELMRGGVLPAPFTPLSRELYLWWWGKTVGIGALGFHLLSLALAAGSTALIYRLGERWVGARAGLVAAGLWIAFAPLGSMLAWVGGSRELVAATAYAATLLLFTRGRWLAAGGMTGLAVLTRETTWTLPLALALADVVRSPRAPWRERAVHLAPAVLAATGGIALVLARGTPAGRGLAVGAPFEFLMAWIPSGSFTGLGLLLTQAPWWVLLTLMAAPFVAPRTAAAKRRDGSMPTGPMPALRLAIGWTVLGLLPLLWETGRASSEVFAVGTLGVCLAAGAALTMAPAWVARATLAALALASLGAHAVTTPSPQLIRYAQATAEAARTRPLIDALSPLCRSLSRVPRTFAASMSPDSVFALALGPGTCVVCRNPKSSVRFLAEFRAEDAATEFGVLRYDPSSARFDHERADGRVRARIGEGLLVFARPSEAAACFASALETSPRSPELAYPLVISLAASGQLERARVRWLVAVRDRIFPGAETLAMRLVGGFAGDAPDSIERVVIELAGQVVANPLAAEPHVALGRQLLEMRFARSAAIEFVAGSGIGKRSQDVYWMARAYDALGVRAEALEAYRAALAGGLDSVTYKQARARFAQLMAEGTPLMMVQPPTRR